MASEARSGRPNAPLRTTAAKRSRIEVRLPPKLPDYVPGSGPPLQRIGLLPPQDSTAYIIDRFLLASPGLAEDGRPLPRRMTYAIGWTDLPAARLLVPAMEILSYVAPLALETWEWDRELEMEAERARLEEERKQPPIPKPGSKRRGKPPVQAKAQAAIVAEPEPDATPKRLKKGVMSLSTPQKASLEAFEGLSDDDASPSRQLERELYGQASASGTPDFMDVDARTETAAGTSTHCPYDTENSEQQPRQSSPASRPEAPSQIEGPISLAQFRASLRPPFHALEREASTSDIPMGNTAPSIPESLPMSDKGDIPSRVSSFKPAGWSSAFASHNGNGVKQFGSSASATPPAPPAKPKPKPKNETERKKPPRKKAQVKPKAEPEQAPEGNDGGWEVKRLEGVRYYEVEGQGVVRYFSVLWEGDWPPDQNPSWEPEDNLPRQLVRNYLKNGKRKRASGPNSATKPKPAKMRQSTLPWAMGRQYSSVSEAFSDHVDSTHNSGIAERSTSEDFDGEKELFVVE